MVILDLFYELLHLDVPDVCDSYDAALKSLCNYSIQCRTKIFHSIFLDQIWNLTTVEEGYTYVASEGAAKLPRLSATRYATLSYIVLNNRLFLVLSIV